MTSVKMRCFYLLKKKIASSSHTFHSYAWHNITYKCMNVWLGVYFIIKKPFFYICLIFKFQEIQKKRERKNKIEFKQIDYVHISMLIFLVLIYSLFYYSNFIYFVTVYMYKNRHECVCLVVQVQEGVKVICDESHEIF